MRLLFLSFFILLAFFISYLKADEINNTPATSELANSSVVSTNSEVSESSEDAPNSSDDTSKNEEEIKAYQKNKKVTLQELDKIIEKQYSYLDDLDLNLEDGIPISGDPEDYVIIYLEKKPIIIRLLPEYAPKTVENFKKLVREKFYDNTDFFRLIPNYIIQGGDPTSSGYGGTGKLRNAEISKDVKFQRGSVAIANNNTLKSDDSQFFISFDAFPWLDGKYTIFGNVISGMKFLETLNGSYSNDGFLPEPLIIERVMVLKDLPENKILTVSPNSRFSPVMEQPAKEEENNSSENNNPENNTNTPNTTVGNATANAADGNNTSNKQVAAPEQENKPQ